MLSFWISAERPHDYASADAVGPLSRAFILIALLGIVQLHYLYMSSNSSIVHSIQLRSRLAKDIEDNRGVYAIGELALFVRHQRQ